MHEHLKNCLEAAKKKIEWLMKIQGEPFTVNNHYMADYREKFLTYYRRARQDAKSRDGGSRAIPWMSLNGRKPMGIKSPYSYGSGDTGSDMETPDATTEVLSLLAKIGYQGLTKEDLPRLLEQDAMEPALEIMATVRAYFQGALPAIFR